MKQVLINRLERLEQQTKRSCVGLILPVRNGWVTIRNGKRETFSTQEAALLSLEPLAKSIVVIDV